MDSDARLVYRLLLAVDVERYSKRNAVEQLRAQNDLRQTIEDAASRSGLDRDVWYKQVRGDGELAVLPPEVDVLTVVGTFVSHLEAALVDVNDGCAGRPLRLRLAMHHGTLASGPFGPIGDAPIVVSRLLDAPPLRKLLAERRDGDLGLVVSDTLFKDVVSTGFCPLDPAEFEAIRITVKGTSYRGHIRGSLVEPDEAMVLTFSAR
jgi:hypothetical protein